MYNRAIPILWTLGGLLVALGLVVGCASTPSPQLATSSPPTRAPEATTFVSVLPTPKPSGAPVSILPTPDPNWAAVAGTLIGASNGEPVLSTTVFLEKTPQEHSVPGVLYGPPNDQPSTKTNEAGQFLITEVPEGEYVIVVFSPPLDLQVATDPSSGQPLFITTHMGSLIEVGPVVAPAY